MNDAVPSYCCIANVLHISSLSFCFEYKWSYWRSWVKEAKVSTKSIYKDHPDDEVGTEEFAAQSFYESPNMATVALMGKMRKTKLAGGKQDWQRRSYGKQFIWASKFSSNSKCRYTLSSPTWISQGVNVTCTLL